MDKKNKTKVVNPMWGGRFSSSPSQTMHEFNASINFDARLYSQDILASKVHANMLAACDLITEAEASDICRGLDIVEKEIASGQFEFKLELEDLHMHIEARLFELIGEAAQRLHTARSRNDQVATDFKLWVRDAIDRLDDGICRLQEALICKAEEHMFDIMPGFTHLQIAQPVTLSHHLLAYVEMLGRDRGRASDTRRRLNECPLGSAALAGTSLNIDRFMVANKLGFDRPMANSMDAASDRDFAIEFLAFGSILAMHLSRFAEEIIIWNSSQFGYCQVSENFSTGSSIMPQKRNPDAAELIRGKAARVFSSLNSLLIVMKGLPLAYCKDMQEDKEPVFDSSDTLELTLSVMTDMVVEAEFDRDRMRADASHGYSVATDLADWLVSSLGVPFRRAHHIAGLAVKAAEKEKCELKDLPLRKLQKIEPDITEEIFSVLSAENSVKNRTSYGGTASKEIKKRLTEARERFLQKD